MTITDTLLTVNEVASRLKCHPHTVRRWIWANKLRAVKVGELVRVPEREVAKLTAPVVNGHRRGKRKHKPRGAAGLIALMKEFRKQPALIAAAEEMERHIKEARQPADWSDPLA